jgi:hypothetical protein
MLNDKVGRDALKRIELKDDCEKRMEQWERDVSKIIIACLVLGWFLGYYTYNVLCVKSGGCLL